MLPTASSAQRAVLGGYAVTAAANVLASATGARWLDYATKPLLMPLLAAFVLLAPARPAHRSTFVAALLAAWLGDCALIGAGTAFFLAGMGLFLCAHVLFISTYARSGGVARLRARPAVPVVYAALVLILLTVMWSGLEHQGLAMPVAAYAVALGTMAALATGFGRAVAVGAALFLLSDVVLALALSGVLILPEILHGTTIMLTYTVGLALIATGWAARADLPAGAQVTADPVPTPT
jgi:uncharacterized membrane protein YhhN